MLGTGPGRPLLQSVRQGPLKRHSAPGPYTRSHKEAVYTETFGSLKRLSVPGTLIISEPLTYTKSSEWYRNQA